MEFNCPYQIGYYGKFEREHSPSHLKPEQSKQYALQLNVGDIVCVMTDGIWDNLFDHDIVQLITGNCFETDYNGSFAAQRVGEAAYRVSIDPKAHCPANEQYNRGGKPDDITIIVAYVVKGGEKCIS